MLFGVNFLLTGIKECNYSMHTLFEVEPVFPEGFAYHPNFINEAEEQKLLQLIAKTELHNFFFQGYEAKRKVASFGYDWSFEKRTLSKGKEIPVEFDFLIQRLSDHLSIPKTSFAELLVTQYPVGSVINWHRDAPPFDIIAGISLFSDCIFKLRPHDKAKQKRNTVISIPVKKRSLYIIQGIARSEWEHSIVAVKDVRYSVTMRTLKQEYYNEAAI
jgi:alkylated DNA repair dioxygenase AlkB